MVARAISGGGAIEEMAILQKQLIAKASLAGKPVITATQMLESMTASRLPTRAEATDVANAILDGTDCIMSRAIGDGSIPRAVAMRPDRADTRRTAAHGLSDLHNAGPRRGGGDGDHGGARAGTIPCAAIFVPRAPVPRPDDFAVQSAGLDGGATARRGEPGLAFSYGVQR